MPSIVLLYWGHFYLKNLYGLEDCFSLGKQKEVSTCWFVLFKKPQTCQSLYSCKIITDGFNQLTVNKTLYSNGYILFSQAVILSCSRMATISDGGNLNCHIKIQ